MGHGSLSAMAPQILFLSGFRFLVRSKSHTVDWATGKISQLSGKSSRCLSGKFKLENEVGYTLPWFFLNYELLHFKRQVIWFLSLHLFFTVRIVKQKVVQIYKV